jgi:2-succinyl-6-hydroxy-2,4-cyclohexadiene-1-carboxylate synthase
MIWAMDESLMLLHGFTHTGASWNRVRAELGERYRPIALDIRGHGAASATEPVDLGGVLDDLRTAGPGRFALAGYSMGGRIALHAALAMPERITRLVLIGASPGLRTPSERKGRRRVDEALANRVERMTIEQFADEWARTPVLTGLAPDVLAEVHADRLRNTVPGLARALRGLGTGALPSLWERLEELVVPVTLIVGERDAKFRALAARMSAALPGAQLEVVASAGHAVHLEAPDAVAGLLSG